MRPEEFVEIDGDTDIWFAGVISRIAEAIGERIEGLRLRDHRPHIVGEIVVVLAALIGTNIEQLLEQFFKIMSRISANLAGKIEDRRLDRQLDTLSPQREQRPFEQSGAVDARQISQGFEPALKTVGDEIPRSRH